MISRDYTKEVGLEPGTVRVPLPFAVVALVLIATGLWFSIVKLHASMPVRAKEEVPAATAKTPAKPAPAAVVRHR